VQGGALNIVDVIQKRSIEERVVKREIIIYLNGKLGI